MRQRKWLRSSSSWMSFSAGGCWCRSWAEKGRAEWRYSSCPPKALKNPANYQATKIHEGAEKTGGNSPQGEGLKIGFPPLCGRCVDHKSPTCTARLHHQIDG